MKMVDLLDEAYGTFVIRGGRGDYRVDPNPVHSSKDHPESWTTEITNAHVFSERSARKFLRRRAEAEQDRTHVSPYDHKNIRIVPVEVVDGKPQLVKPKKKLGFLRRAFG